MAEVSDVMMLFVLVVGFLVIGGASYYFVNYKFAADITEKDTKIQDLEKRLSEKENQINTLRQTVSAPPGTTVVPPSNATQDVNCLLCHDLKLTKGFHVPQAIMRIDDKLGKRRRICIDCHGPLGPPWSADRQMTDLADITYSANESVFRFPNKVPHSIHKRKLETGAVTCQFCHVVGEEFIIPKADTKAGQVLVCQNCKAHPEGGNYITIHVELKGLKCTICHTGSILDIHKAGTAKLGEARLAPATQQPTTPPATPQAAQ